METENIYPQDNLLEQLITNVSAKVADAVEMVQKAKMLTTASENVLIEAQIELEEICVRLRDKTDGMG